MTQKNIDARSLNSEPETLSPDARPRLMPQLLAIYSLTVAAQLGSLAFGRVNPDQSFAEIVMPSVIALSVVTLPLAYLGLVLGRKIGLGTPRFQAILVGAPEVGLKLRSDLLQAGTMGLVLGGLLLLLREFTAPYLPAELPAFGHRGVIGGLAVSFGAAVAEEVWFRLGLMTLLLWLILKIRGESTVRPAIAWPAIVLIAIGFGAAHLPQLISYGAGSGFAITGTIAGNTAVGILYGWCYWRCGLIAAMIAHFAVDVVLHVLPALTMH